jgi:hypothetical protein
VRRSSRLRRVLDGRRSNGQNKSPGSDGLPAEFYQDFFPYFGPWFINIANAQLAKSLAPSQRLGIITLLPKKDSDKSLLGNWRPVSLLNTDYKIISKTLVNRLKKLANRFIGDCQNSAVPGRSIYDTLHLLRNVFDYCKDRGFPCLAVSLDQAKAFDKVHHGYLFYIMEQMGIGPSFLSMVRQLYNDIYSQVLVNGFLTVAFKISRSVRQGCGLSPLLFNIAIEPLIISISQSLLFRGIPIPGYAAEERAICFADDLTLIAQNEFSVGVAFSLFEVYSKASGAELNVSKTTALAVNGSFRQSLLPRGVEITNNAKICGVYFGSEATELNEKALTVKIEKAIANLHLPFIHLLRPGPSSQHFHSRQTMAYSHSHSLFKKLSPTCGDYCLSLHLEENGKTSTIRCLQPLFSRRSWSFSHPVENCSLYH